MLVLTTPITSQELAANHIKHFRNMVKAVVDVERGVLAVDAELHADLEALLLDQGSKQENLWGINLYPHKTANDFIQYTALINIKPWQNNAGMEIIDAGLRGRIRGIVQSWISDAA